MVTDKDLLWIVGFGEGESLTSESFTDASWITWIALRLIRMPGTLGTCFFACGWPLDTRSAAETLQDMPGHYKDAQGRVKDTLDGYMDLTDISGWGLRIVIFLADVSL